MSLPSTGGADSFCDPSEAGLLVGGGRCRKAKRTSPKSRHRAMSELAAFEAGRWMCEVEWPDVKGILFEADVEVRRLRLERAC